MLHTLERDYEQSSSEVEKEFPNSRLLMSLDDIDAERGKLLAVCDSIADLPKFDEYIEEHSQFSNIFIFGFFDEEISADIDY